MKSKNSKNNSADFVTAIEQKIQKVITKSKNKNKKTGQKPKSGKGL